MIDRQWFGAGRRHHVALVVVMLSAIASGAIGCHTFQPAGIPRPGRLEAVPSSDVPVRLVINEPFAEYESRDSGHPLADPQRYELGPALVSLCEAHFSRAFALIPASDNGPTKIEWEYAIEPKVEWFDNLLETSGPTQRIRIELRARIRSRDDPLVSEVWARGQDTHPVGTLTVDVPETERFLNEVLDATVARLATMAGYEVARDVVAHARADEESLEPPAVPDCVPRWCGRITHE
jgi:hypothetical protein